MKKFLKFITLSSLAFILVACGSGEEQTAESSAPAESTEAPAESTTDTEEESQETESETTTEGESEPTDDSATSGEEAPASDATDEGSSEDEPSSTGVTFTFNVTGEEAPIAEYTVEDAEGMSILEAMESIEELDFTFNEEEGVIDQIGEYTNDYTAGTTWAYLLNGQYAELGVVSQTLEAGDEIEWYYGTADEIPINVVPADDTATTEEVPVEEEPTEAP